MSPLIRSIDIVIPAKDPSSILHSCIESISHQLVPQGWSLSIIVVDDGSLVPIEIDHRDLPCLLTVLRHKKNKGRSSAINTGVHHSQADACWVLDADCVLSSNDALGVMIEHYLKGNTYCFGRTKARGEDFWAQYHNEVASHRFSKTRFSDFTTACFFFDRAMLVADGGFNEDYSHYGFEDKHLIVDIIKARGLSSLFLVENVVALHDDSHSVSGVVDKFTQSARYSAPVFCNAHSDYYRQLLYSRFDARVISSQRKLLLAVLFAGIAPLASMAEKLIASSIPPFVFKKNLVKLLCARAYYQGSLVDTL